MKFFEFYKNKENDCLKGTINLSSEELTVVISLDEFKNCIENLQYKIKQELIIGEFIDHHLKRKMYVDLDNVSHLITNMHCENNILHFSVKILNTKRGNILKKHWKSSTPSLRMTGKIDFNTNINGKHPFNDLHITTLDIIYNRKEMG